MSDERTDDAPDEVIETDDAVEEIRDDASGDDASDDDASGDDVSGDGVSGDDDPDGRGSDDDNPAGAGSEEDASAGDGSVGSRADEVIEDEPRAEGEFAADGELEAADAEPIPGTEPDEAGEALLSRLRLIEDQDLDSRAGSLGQVHDELRSRLESGDGTSRPV